MKEKNQIEISKILTLRLDISFILGSSSVETCQCVAKRIIGEDVMKDFVNLEIRIVRRNLTDWTLCCRVLTQFIRILHRSVFLRVPRGVLFLKNRG